MQTGPTINKSCDRQTWAEKKETIKSIKKERKNNCIYNNIIYNNNVYIIINNKRNKKL